MINTPMKRTINRYIVLILAAIVNFCYGSAYIWTVFQPAAKEKFSLEASSANRPFAVFMSLFVFGNIFGGKLQQKIGPRLTVYIGSFFMCSGFLLTSFIPENGSMMISLTYGCMGGAGAGIAYNALVATIPKWFPDKRGLITGIIICTVGAPGLVMTPICNHWIEVAGFSKAMLWVALLYFVICFAGGWVIANPPDEYMKEIKPNTANTVLGNKQYTTSEMLKSKKYYLISGAMMCAVLAYFLINPMIKSLGLERGLSESEALKGIMISSVMNVVGRLIIPWISDKLGRTSILYILFIFSMLSVLCLTIGHGQLFIFCVIVVSFCYGGFFGVFPVITTDLFGTKYSGMNYGFVMIGYGIVSILCPLLTAVGVVFSFTVAGAVCLLGTILTMYLRKIE